MTFDGRVVEEALREWPNGSRPAEASETVALDRSTGEALYTVKAQVTVVGGVRYFDVATVTRRPRAKER